MLRSLSIVTDAFRSGDQVIFPPAERIKALAGFGVTAGLGTVSGPLLGGLLTQHSLLGPGWRSIFLINVPVGIIAVAAAAILVRESRAPRPPKLARHENRPTGSYGQPTPRIGAVE